MKLLLILASALTTFAFECYHDPEPEVIGKSHRRTIDEPGRGLVDRSDQLAGLRIKYHIPESILGAGYEAQEAELMEVLEACKVYYKNVLKTWSVTENLILPSTTYCSNVVVPEEFSTVGVPDADIVIWVVGDFDPNQVNFATIGTGGPCVRDGGTIKAPIAGKFTVKSLNWVQNSRTFTDAFTIAMHEIMHILGFAGDTMQNVFQDSSNNWQPYPEPIYINYSVLNQGKPANEQTIIRGRNDRILLKSPTVLRLAKEIFGCDSIEGMEIENGGGTGTKGSHWEKELMYNDFMVGDSGGRHPRFSELTFAVMQDSGHYVYVKEFTDSVDWLARYQGCRMFEQPCKNDQGESNFPDMFCTNIGQKGCDWTINKKGYCNADNSLLDGCGLYFAYSNGDCKYTGTTNPTAIAAFYGEETGENALCHEYLSKDEGEEPVRNTGCYATTCKADGTYDITMDNPYFGLRVVTCQSEGQEHSLDYENFTGQEYRKLYCQAYDKVCPSVPICPNVCNGHGSCKDDGTCNCMPNWSGTACENQGAECSINKCQVCKSATECQTCQAPYVPSQDQTQCNECPAKFYYEDQTCKACGANCDQCSSNTTCLACASGGFIPDPEVPRACKCPDGQYNKNGVCTPCGQNCKKCNSATDCTTCQDAYPKNNGNGTCGCNDYFYNNGTSCSACGNRCKTCTSTSCTQCESLVLTAQSDGSCDCGSGQYYNGSQCLACGDNCAKCDASKCTQCSIVSFIIDANDQKRCVCADGSEPVSGSCAVCNFSCKTCTVGQSTCSSCNDPAFPNSSNLCQCPTGYSMNDDGFCIVDGCATQCANCKTDNKQFCTGCKGDHVNYNEIQGTCTCDGDYIREQSTGLCMVENCNKQCGTCEKYNKDVCLTCKSHAYEQNNSCFCDEGYSMDTEGNCQECDNFFVQSEVTMLVNSSGILVVSFNGTVDKSLVNSVSTALTDTSKSYMGTNATFAWVSGQNKFNITPGAGANFFNKEIELKAGNFKKIYLECRDVTAIKMVPTLPSPVPSPVGNVSSPSTYSVTCSTGPLTLDASQSTGCSGQAVLHKWSTQPSLSLGAFGTYSSSNQVLNIQQTSFTPTFLEQLTDSKLTVTYYVKNCFGVEVTKTFQITITNAPALSAQLTPSGVSHPTEDQLFLTASATFCGNSNATVSFSWSFVSSTCDDNLNISTDLFCPQDNSCALVADRGQAGCTYVVKVTVQEDGSESAEAEGEFSIISGDPVVVLDRNSGDHSASQDLVINGSQSYDPNQQGCTPVYQWSVQVDDVPAVDSNGNLLVNDTNQGNSQLVIAKEALFVGLQYIVTLTYSVCGRHSQATVVFYIKAGGAWYSVVSNVQRRVYPSYRHSIGTYVYNGVSGLQYRWQQKCGISVTPVSGYNANPIVFDYYTFTQGDTQCWTGQSYNSQYVLNTEFTFLVNQGPTNCNHTLSPLSGTTSTVFTATSTGCVDGDGLDNPLTYSWYVLYYGTWYCWSCYQYQNYFSFQPYVGMTEFRIEVCDSKWTCNISNSFSLSVTNSRRIEDVNIIDEFKQKIKNKNRVLDSAIYYCMAFPEMDDNSYQLILQEVLTYFAPYTSLDSNQIESIIGVASALLNPEMDDERLSTIIGFLRESIEKLKTELNNTQASAILNRLYEYIIDYSELVYPLINEIQAELLDKAVPDMTPIILTFANTEISAARTVAIEGASKKIIDTANLKVEVSAGAMPSDNIFDIQTVVTYDEDGDMLQEIQLLSYRSGTYEPFQSIIDPQRKKIDSFVRPISVTVNHIHQNEALQCYSEIENSCSLSIVSDSKMRLDITSPGTFTIKTAILPVVTPNIDATSESDDDKCIENLSPIYIGLVVLVICAVTAVIGTVIDRMQDKEEPVSAVMPIMQTETDQTPMPKEPLNISTQNDTSSMHLNSPEGIISPENNKDYSPTFERSVQSSHSLLSRFIRTHQLISLFVFEYRLSRTLKITRMFACIMFQFMILGAFQKAFNDAEDDGEVITGQQAFEEYEGKDFGVVLLTLLVCLPVTMGFQFLYYTKSEELRFERKLIGGIISTLLLITSFSIIVYLSLAYCHQPSGIWSVGFLFLTLLDLILRQTLTGLVAALLRAVQQFQQCS